MMHFSIRRFSVLLMLFAAGVAVLASGGLTSKTSADTPTVPTAPELTSCNGPSVHSDRSITFCLTAPQASSVALNWQDMVGRSPAADAIPMSKQSNGIWAVTIGPQDPNLYSYGFIVDSAKIADPANRDSWTSTATAFGGAGSWSNVLVPGPGSDYIADSPRVPHGDVATVHYYSRYTRTERQMQVYTPPGYGRDNRQYPVLYLLHGVGGNDTDWFVNMRANFILDNQIAARKAVPMIVVSPDTNVGPFPTGVTDDEFEKELMRGVVPYVEHNYRTAPGTRNRALAGLSMGSNHTRNIMFLDEGEFAYYGLFSSGAMSPAAINDVLNHPDLITGLARSKETKLIWISEGGLEPEAFPNVEANLKATLQFFDQHGIEYRYVDGPDIGADFGHVWDTWREHLNSFAPLLFRKAGGHHHHHAHGRHHAHRH
jgi:enterochelin esterase-like enzyme